jgi:hypothetical protein
MARFPWAQLKLRPICEVPVRHVTNFVLILNMEIGPWTDETKLPGFNEFGLPPLTVVSRHASIDDAQKPP